MYKEHKIILLPIDKPVEGCLLENPAFDKTKYGIFSVPRYDLSWTKKYPEYDKYRGWFPGQPKYYYILSDEEIKGGDWAYEYVPIGQPPFVVNILRVISVDKEEEGVIEFEDHTVGTDFCKKVISSNDPKLNLPQLEDKDLQTWCDNPADTILVEYEVLEGKEWLNRFRNSLNKADENAVLIKLTDNKLSVNFENDWDRILKSYISTRENGSNIVAEAAFRLFTRWLKENYKPPTKK